eukprot:scaffold323_cov414-Prasinococcus_capsulatus_cf.AAC.38
MKPPPENARLFVQIALTLCGLAGYPRPRSDCEMGWEPTLLLETYDKTLKIVSLSSSRPRAHGDPLPHRPGPPRATEPACVFAEVPTGRTRPLNGPVTGRAPSVRFMAGAGSGPESAPAVRWTAASRVVYAGLAWPPTGTDRTTSAAPRRNPTVDLGLARAGSAGRRGACALRVVPAGLRTREARAAGAPFSGTGPGCRQEPAGRFPVRPSPPPGHARRLPPTRRRTRSAAATPGAAAAGRQDALLRRRRLPVAAMGPAI